MRALARSDSVLPQSSAMPYSVTTYCTSYRGVVTTPPLLMLGTILERLPPWAVEVRATIDRPPGESLAPFTQSACPPTPPICRSPMDSAFTWPVRSTSIAELIAMKFGILAMVWSLCVYVTGCISKMGLLSTQRYSLSLPHITVATTLPLCIVLYLPVTTPLSISRGRPGGSTSACTPRSCLSSKTPASRRR